MGLIEAILVGIQFKRLQKPLIFICMLFGFLLFSVFGIGLIAAGIEAYIKTSKNFVSLGIASMSLVLFALSAVCGYFIKRCVE